MGLYDELADVIEQLQEWKERYRKLEKTRVVLKPEVYVEEMEILEEELDRLVREFIEEAMEAFGVEEWKDFFEYIVCGFDVWLAGG